MHASGKLVQYLESLSERKIKKALGELNRALIKYPEIQKEFWRTDVSKAVKFQRKFNGFYRVRRGKLWQKTFYSLMEEGKKKTFSFENVLKKIHQKTGRWEASFTSKLIATLDPQKPVIDKFILQNVNLKLPRQYARNREEETVQLYKDLCAAYKAALNHRSGRKICRMFNAEHKEHRDISELKKIDLVLWQIRN